MQQARVHAGLLGQEQLLRGRDSHFYSRPNQAHLHRLRPQPGLLHPRHVDGRKWRESGEPDDHFIKNHQSGTERRKNFERLREVAVQVDAESE